MNEKSRQTDRSRESSQPKKKGLARAKQIFLRMNWRGRLIVLGGAAVLIAAVAVPVALAGAAPQQPKQALAAAALTETEPTTPPLPTPTRTPLPTPTPEPISTTPPDPTEDPTLQKGDENERVMALQNRLMDLGYLSLDEATMYFGPSTQYAVKMFQRQHDLQQDGIAGAQTLLMIYDDDAKPYTLLEGTRGNDVDTLQRQLQRLGYLDKATGYYGTETVAAVKAFQERNGLTVDGKTGEHTLDVIYSPGAKPTAEKEKEAYQRANIDRMIEVAREQLGKPYVWGAEGPNSFDCSGFVYYCLKAAGSDRGRYNAKGYSEVAEWDKIEGFNDLQVGDLLFFWSSSRHKIGHVGIYIGDGKMIDASQTNNAIIIRDCHWSSYRYARRPW